MPHDLPDKKTGEVACALIYTYMVSTVKKKTTVVEREAYDTAAFNTFCKMGEVADFE